MIFSKSLKAIIGFFILAQSAAACDICGCNMSGNYGGIYPQFTKNIIGFRYGHQIFNHPNTDLNFNGSSRVVQDQFQTYEVWGRFYPHPRVQVFAFVPYRINTREETERTTELSGIGDMSVMVNYTLFNTGDSITRGPWKHAFLVGAGVKLPTGKYMQRDERRVSLPSQFQLGTGAYTYILNANYTLRYGQWGMNLDYAYRFNTENERSYRFGDQWSTAGNLFYTINRGSTAFLPNAGVSYEHYGIDEEFGVDKEQTGGELFLFNTGLDVYVDRFFVRATVQVPLSQEIPFAQPATEARLSIGVSYTF